MSRRRHTINALTTITLFFCIFTSGCSNGGQEEVDARIEKELYEYEIYKDGYDEGYHYGYADGYGKATEEAQQGLENAYDQGYENGYDEGYYDCLVEYGLVEKSSSDDYPPLRLIPDE